MTPIRDTIVLKRRFRALKRQHRFLKRMERKRRIHVHGLRLSQRLRISLQKKKQISQQRRLEKKKRIMAKRETAKLNRTLKRRRTR